MIHISTLFLNVTLDCNPDIIELSDIVSFKVRINPELCQLPGRANVVAGLTLIGGAKFIGYLDKNDYANHPNDIFVIDFKLGNQYPTGFRLTLTGNDNKEYTLSGIFNAYSDFDLTF